jgi:hypothetical protein
MQELKRRAAELAYLNWDLRNAPVVDKPLAAVAQRLRKLAPDNAAAMKLCERLEQRIRLAESQPRGEPLPWARPSQETPLGVPVEWSSGFHRMSCGETIKDAALSQNPGRFAVACGLALAGLKRADLRINLLSGKDNGVWSRVAHLVQSPMTTKKRAGESTWASAP